MDRCEPIILPEEPASMEAAACTKCELAGQRSRVIWGEGNPVAPVFVVLDNPGAREDKEGAAFVCGTRDTLQQGMMEAGLTVDDVYVSYLLKCRPTRAYNKPLAREACFPYLQLQLESKKPRVLLGLGNVVCQTLLDDETAEVKCLRGSLHEVRGIPAYFAYHPLAVRRRPVLMKAFVQDLRLVADYLRT